MGQSRVAIIDDDPDIQVFLRELFESEGYAVETFLTAQKGLEAFRPDCGWDLLICDLKLPDMNGLELVEQIRAKGLDVPVILITAHGAIETAAQALRQGIFDYITKPINAVELSVLSARAIKIRRLELDYQRLQKQMNQVVGKGSLIGKSHKMRQIFDLVDRVAATFANVLIGGESGTGKELVARAIHEGSSRAKAPFMAINCSAIPDHLLESELFGHRRGAFTGANENRRGLIEEANGGTLFLDEIGDMPLPLQSKLLRVIQERKIKPVGSNALQEIDVRIVAATHKDLKSAIAAGTFREDLYFRLCVVPILIPPLRDRPEDIPILAEHFLAKCCEKNGLPSKRLSKGSIQKLSRMEWPGNVRELENAIERAVVLCDRETIEENEIRVEGMPRHEPVRDLFSKLPTLSQLEREYIAYVLAETANHKDRASEILGINRKTLYRKERESK